jgi:hypothetical protein
MVEHRVTLALWLSLAAALLASCSGHSVSRTAGGDDDDRGATGGNAGNSGANGGTAATGGTPATGGSSGAAGSAQSGSGGGGGAALCTDNLAPSDCDDDLNGSWLATACPLEVSGVVDLSGLGLLPECSTAPVNGYLQVSGSVTFDETMHYSDGTITSGESTFELAPECVAITTCDTLSGVLARALGYASVSCVDNAATLGCTCSATVYQTGGLAFVSHAASTSGTYATTGSRVVLNAFESDTEDSVREYDFCASQRAQVLNLSLMRISKTGAVVDPIAFVKP